MNKERLHLVYALGLKLYVDKMVWYVSVDILHWTLFGKLFEDNKEIYWYYKLIMTNLICAVKFPSSSWI